jgi:hypothetical protein
MKSVFPIKSQIKILIALWLGLALLFFIRPTHVASKPLNQATSNDLYRNVITFENNQDYIHATIYLFAYVQQNPPEYANNINGHKSIVDKHMAYLFGKTNDSVDLLKKVNADLNNCKHFPCDQSSLDSTFVEVPIGSLPPPPHVVLVCTKPKYKGLCNLLPVGNYRTYQSLGVPNDSITSVMVGSQVKITFYTDGLGAPPMITFAKDDSDLRNNMTSDGYRWSKVISTAKVEWR